MTYPVVARAWAAVCLARVGEFAEGTILAAEAVRAAEATNRPWDLAVTLLYEGELYLYQGAFARAILALERGRALGESVDIAYISQQIVVTLGYAYALTDRPTEAVQLLEGVGKEASVQELAVVESRRVAYASEAYLLEGRLADSLEAAGRAVALARQHKERGNEAWALRLLGDIAAQADPPDTERAEGYYRQALALAEELGMRPLAAHCHLGLGTLSQKIGRHRQAEAELASAAEMYRAMEMAYWLGKAETALALTTD